MRQCDQILSSKAVPGNGGRSADKEQSLRKACNFLRLSFEKTVWRKSVRKRDSASKCTSWEGNSKIRVLGGVCRVHGWGQGNAMVPRGSFVFVFPQELCKNAVLGC